MPELKIIEVILLNGECLQFSCEAKILTCEILTDVCQILHLKERNYFGLTYNDDKGYEHWLQFEKKILEHELPKKNLKIEIFFKVRFFIEKFQLLTDLKAIQLIHAQLKSNLLKGFIDIKDDSIFELCALILQQEIGNFISINESKSSLRKLQLISTSLLSRHPSITYCEDRVVCYHEQLIGHTYGSCLINFISIIENLPAYGFHFYYIKDKNGIQWWLGVGFKGIAIFDNNDKLIPRKLFEWRLLENLSFRDKKFIAEIREQKKSNSFSGKLHVKTPCRYTIVSHAWTLATSCLAKTVWMMAVNQHQFYLDRKQLRNSQRFVWNLQCLVNQLDNLKENEINIYNHNNLDKLIKSDKNNFKEHSTNNSLEEMYNSNSTPNLSTLSMGKNQMPIKDHESVKLIKVAECERLKLKKSALEELLSLKLQMLKEVCLKEAELTGTIPIEYPQIPGEEIPKLRKRRGTSFTISQRFLTDDNLNEQDFEMAKLEMEFEVNDNRTMAMLKLAQDIQNPKNIRKKYRSIYIKEYQKLKELEEKINKLRACKGQSFINKQQNSIEDLSEDSREFLDEVEEMDAVPATTPVKFNSILRNSFRNKFKRYAETFPATNKDKMDNSSLYHESSSDNQSLNSVISHNQSINSDQSISNYHVDYKVHEQLQERPINSDKSSLNHQVEYRVLPKKNKHELEATLRGTIGSRQRRRHSSGGKKLTISTPSPISATAYREHNVSSFSDHNSIATNNYENLPCQTNSPRIKNNESSMNSDSALHDDYFLFNKENNDNSGSIFSTNNSDNQMCYNDADLTNHSKQNPHSMYMQMPYSNFQDRMHFYYPENVQNIKEGDNSSENIDLISSCSLNSNDPTKNMNKKKQKDIYAKIRRICRARTACEFNPYNIDMLVGQEINNHFDNKHNLIKDNKINSTSPIETDFPVDYTHDGSITLPRIKHLSPVRRASDGLLIKDFSNLSIHEDHKDQSLTSMLAPFKFPSNRDSFVYNLNSCTVTNKFISNEKVCSSMEKIDNFDADVSNFVDNNVFINRSNSSLPESNSEFSSTNELTSHNNVSYNDCQHKYKNDELFNSEFTDNIQIGSSDNVGLKSNINCKKSIMNIKNSPQHNNKGDIFRILDGNNSHHSSTKSIDSHNTSICDNASQKSNFNTSFDNTSHKSNESCISSQIVNDVYSRYRTKLRENDVQVSLRNKVKDNSETEHINYLSNYNTNNSDLPVYEHFNYNSCGDSNVSSMDLIFLRTDQHKYDKNLERRATPAPAFVGSYMPILNQHNDQNYHELPCNAPIYNYLNFNGCVNGHKNFNGSDSNRHDTLNHKYNSSTYVNGNLNNLYGQNYLSRSNNFSPASTVFPSEANSSTNSDSYNV